MGDKHDKCENTLTCLCAEDKHGVSLKNGVKADNRMSSPTNEPLEYEKSRHNALTLATMRDEGIGNNTPEYALIEFTKLLIVSDHIISKFDLIKEMKEFCRMYRLDDGNIDPTLKMVFSDMDVFNNVKRIANGLGRVKKEISFDKTQTQESAEWLKGRYDLKRIEVTGNLLFFNGQYYDTDAEAWIRRTARSVIVNGKTAEVTEILKYIEDSCQVVTWKDIEKSIHLKCLLNGIYNIKTGVFSTKFNPDYIILNQIPHNYNEDATWDDILTKVKTLLTDDKHRQSYFDFLSSCLHPYTGLDYQFGMVGGTGTGKSQLGFLATFVIGEENTKDATIHLLADDQTTQKNVAFKMLNIDYDLSSESVERTDVIKKWITQDRFTARGIYEQSSDFRPMARLMFMANDLYEIPNEDDAEAIYDRSYLVRVDKKFRHQDSEIKNIMQKTATVPELEGLITYLLKNATWMYENEKYHHTIAVKDVEAIWNSFGNYIKQFTEKMLVYGVFREEASIPYNNWMAYCVKIGHKPKSKKEFSEIFNEIVGSTPSPTRNKDGDAIRSYTGFRFKTDEEIAKEETTPFSPFNSTSQIGQINENTPRLDVTKETKINPKKDIQSSYDSYMNPTSLFIKYYFENYKIKGEKGVASVAKSGDVCLVCSSLFEYSKFNKKWMCMGCQDRETREFLQKQDKDREARKFESD